jgi:transposase
VFLVEYKNRLASAPKAVTKRIKAHLRWLEAELGRANKDLDQAIRQSPIWKENEDLLQSAPAIGPAVSRTLIAELPELGKLNRKQIAGPGGNRPA